MPHSLRFDANAVRRVVEHAKAAPEHMEFYGEKQGARVLLVKDEGIYLMSNGLPRDLMARPFDPSAPPPTANDSTSFVAYAMGYDPTKADRMAVWEKCREAVGGDDFSEPLLLDGFERGLADPQVNEFVITVTPKELTIHGIHRPTRKRT